MKANDSLEDQSIDGRIYLVLKRVYDLDLMPVVRDKLYSIVTESTVMKSFFFELRVSFLHFVDRASCNDSW